MKDREKEFRERVKCGIAYCEDSPFNENKEKQIKVEETNKQLKALHDDIVDNLFKGNTYKLAEDLILLGWRKLLENSVVLSREEYDELINLQRTYAEDLTNAIQSYKESKEEIKIEYNNHIKNLEKTIDRQSKDLNSQADRIIDLKKEVENKSKEVAREFYDKFNKNICYFELKNKSTEYKEGYIQAVADICGKLDKTAIELGVDLREYYGKL